MKLFKVKSQKRKRSKGRAGRNDFRRWIKRQPPELNYYKIIKIVQCYRQRRSNYNRANNHHRHINSRPKHIERISKRKIKPALNAMINRQHGKDNRTIGKIADEYDVGRATLYRYYRNWRKNPNRANYTPLHIDHMPKDADNNH